MHQNAFGSGALTGKVASGGEEAEAASWIANKGMERRERRGWYGKEREKKLDASSNVGTGSTPMSVC